MPLGKMVEFSGMFFRGSALGGLGGAIGQDVLFSGSLVSPASIFAGTRFDGRLGAVEIQAAAEF